MNQRTELSPPRAKKPFLQSLVNALGFPQQGFDERTVIIDAIFRRNFGHAFAILELDPRVAIELAGKLEQRVIEWREAVLADDGNAEVDDARASPINYHQIVFTLKVSVRDAPLVHFVDEAEQPMKKSFGIGYPC
jgi:hypothetical protein